MDFSGAVILNADSAERVNSKIRRFAELLREYDSDLDAKIVPSFLRRDANSKPYAVVHSPSGCEPYVVFYFSDNEDPVNLFARIIDGDTRRGNVVSRIEALEEAQRKFKEREAREELLQAADEFHFLATSRSSNYVRWVDRNTGKIVKLDSNRRRVE